GRLAEGPQHGARRQHAGEAGEHDGRGRGPAGPSRGPPHPPRQQHAASSHSPSVALMFPAVSQSYLSQKLNRPLPTKDGGTLRTVLDARAYMFRLSKDRERSARWQRVAQLLLAKADVGAVSRQLELALLYDGKLDVRERA